jgi:hypothetical protein
MVTDRLQVELTIYVIFAVPTEIPNTPPVELPTLAIKVAEELHVPPGVAQDRVIALPTHTIKGAVVIGINVSTVTIAVSKQPPGNL